MIPSPQPPSPIVNDWIERHRDPRSFLLHLVGIPATILGALLMPVYIVLFSGWVFLLALALFFGGFALQFVGHALDGTEPGELRALRRAVARRRSSFPAGATPERAV